MKNLVGSFLDRFGDKPFFLYIPFHDPHRCGHTNPELGEFCQKFGDSVSGFGTIPDWEPTYYSDEEVIVPGTVPDTRATRSEIANQYTTISRLDQGIGLIMDELTARGHINETLVIYSSDNGIPFPNGRTNFYDLGIHQPLLISSPVHPRSHGQSVASLVSLLDVTPTVLDWFRIPYPRYKMFHHSPSVRLTGKSLLPALDYMSGGQTDLMHQERTVVFGSHNLHEVTMYYPMRYIRGPRFKLIRNLAHESYFPIDQDFFLSKSLQDLLLRFRHKKDLRWIKTWPQYLIRPQWELFDLESDPLEIHNLAVDSKFQAILKDLQDQLTAWLNVTQDPWICGPNQVLEDKGSFKDNPQCFSYLF
ncbi:hypothetical protein TCAL_10750 [Tigriopus californicus]|uniref:Sulfatase N-terminal domain-containing protein n=2 Tax=Tigriopus californicus TaxID=6832 RepID=A0A553NVN1_TIGCA|nr:hypothetical protein TCAL_10750 [Tigriopus californicus]